METFDQYCLFTQFPSMGFSKHSFVVRSHLIQESFVKRKCLQIKEACQFLFSLQMYDTQVIWSVVKGKEWSINKQPISGSYQQKSLLIIREISYYLLTEHHLSILFLSGANNLPPFNIYDWGKEKMHRLDCFWFQTAWTRTP